ncbi:unnamed protein product [Zymoseptoria tritici ST99CH_3D1]|uniref:Large ribosomal subunit protein mL54 n=1 Tax=Zymoseptoria tritici (strain CBS 115943 / IPO323) TaxID=336722 RepID=F9X104_ZYMTI|nr:uncharacterized protein MYCGRDRAFT_66222 [Zymoseptoria tritici IPO323]EGP92316.1 hypothetical protein MYCGRDRAFT_66222 [Zymoseptoria tritici IPO323]SMR44475.1 unnamed protein product [Zymoseptoria tritici ST99CH_3D1]
MICQRCLQRLSRRNPTSTLRQPSRFLSQTSSSRAEAVTLQTTQATNPRPNDKPAATSTSAAQPFSTPLTPNPRAGKSESAKPVTRIQSSVPAGTVLKGLNFMKNKQDPVAMEDHEYPSWLWEVLAEQKDSSSSKGADAEGDLFSKSKKQRRIAAKALRKQMMDPEAMATKIPLYEQTIDLPRGDGTLGGNKEAGQARKELTKAMRDQRRSKIKEANFLKEMR